VKWGTGQQEQVPGARFQVLGGNRMQARSKALDQMTKSVTVEISHEDA